MVFQKKPPHVWHFVGITDDSGNKADVTDEHELKVAARLLGDTALNVDITEPLHVMVDGPVSMTSESALDVNVVNTSLAITEPVTVEGTVSVVEPVTVEGSVDVTGSTVSILGTVPVSISGQPIAVTQSGTFTLTPASLGPVTSLNAVNTTGAGTALDAGQVIAGATMHVFATGGPTFDVEVQVSTDNVNWFDTGAAITVSGTSARAEAHGRYYRANLTQLSGGTLPTVTAIIASSF